MTLSFADTRALARRYASALFAEAHKAKALPAVEQDVRSLIAVWEASSAFRRIAANPTLKRDEQAKAVLKSLGSLKLSKSSQRFIEVLAAHRRLPQLPDIARAFLDQVQAGRGEQHAKVLSAVPLNKKQLSAVEKVLSEALKVKISAESAVDPSLIGGLRIKVGSMMLDSSLDTKLEKIRLTLHSAVRAAS